MYVFVMEKKTFQNDGKERTFCCIFKRWRNKRLKIKKRKKIYRTIWYTVYKWIYNKPFRVNHDFEKRPLSLETSETNMF